MHKSLAPAYLSLTGSSAMLPEPVAEQLSQWNAHRAQALACTRRLSDAQWHRILIRLANSYRRPRIHASTRAFLEAVLCGLG